MTIAYYTAIVSAKNKQDYDEHIGAQPTECFPSFPPGDPQARSQQL
jgi:hypothetical protein